MDEELNNAYCCCCE